MAEDNGRIYLGMGLDTQELKKDAEKVKKELEDIGKSAQVEGKRIDNAFDKGFSNAAKSFRTLDNVIKDGGDSVSDYFNEIKESLSFQKGIINDLERDYKTLEKTISKTAPSTQKLNLITESKALQREIQAEKGALSALEVEHKKLNSGYTEMSRQLRTVQAEMMRLAQAGRQNTGEYRALEQEAAKLTTTITSVQKNVRLLSNERSNFQGFTEGVRGLVGAFSVGQGVVGLFSKENENLSRIMVRLQAAMAIAIGMQEASNLLNKNSVFQTVTLTRVKNLYAASLVRLSTALGVSTIAAHALMAALTVGVSAAIAGAIYLWDKYSKSQEDAAKKIKETLEVERDGHATMLKTRFELDNTIRSLQDFNGTKEEEKKKVKELNSAYGESFGYYKTTDEWLTTLINKGDAYVDSLFFQIKAQALLQKAVESDEKARELQSTKTLRDFQTPVSRIAGSLFPDFEIGIKEATKRQSDAYSKQNETTEKYLNEAKELERQRQNLLRSSNIGGFEEPDKPKDTSKKDAADRKRAEAERLRIQRETQERKQRIIEAEKDIAQTILDYNLNLQKINIDLLNEGLEKELKQIDYNYNRLISENEKRRADMLKQLVDIERLEWENKNPKAKEQGLTFTSKIKGVDSDLEEDQLALLRDFAVAALAIKTKATQEANDKVKELELKDARELHESLLADKIKYAALEAEAEQIELMKGSFNWEADRKKQQVLLDISTTQERLAEQLKEGTSESVIEVERLRQELEKLGIVLNNIPSEKIAEMGERFSSFASVLGGLDGEVGRLFSDLSKNISNVTKAVADFNKEGASGGEKWGKAIEVAIGYVVDIINSITQASKARKEAERQNYIDTIAFAHQYALALNEQLRLQSQLSGSQFVRDYSAEIGDAFNAASDAVLNYNDAIDKLAEGEAKTGERKRKTDWSVVGASAISGAATGAIAGTGTGAVGIGTLIGGAIGAVAGGIAGLFKATKKVDVFAPLLQVHKNLVDENGELNKSLAQTLISTNQLDDKTKMLVQNALDWSNAVDEANKQISDIVGELTGDLGNSIKEALVGAWKSGEDAAMGMFAAVNDSLANLIENIVYGLTLAPVFKKFEEDLTEALKAKDYVGVSRIYKEMADAAKEQRDVFNESMDFMKGIAQDNGLDPWANADTRTGMTKGFSAMTQDTGEELSGRFTVIQGHTFEIVNIMRLGQQNSLVQTQHLAAIVTNTARLEAVERYISTTSEAISDIRDRGVKML